MSEARINRISNEKGDGGPSLSGITNFSGLNYFVPPKGTTAERPSDCPPGSIRFNTDSAHLEYFDGLQWLEFEATNDELGVNGALGNRGLFGGGRTPSLINAIEFITISTVGNTQGFGDLSSANFNLSACSSSTRGIFGGGRTPAYINVIEYITISSTGNAQDFGDLSVGKAAMGACSSSTRGIFGGGSTPTPATTFFNVIEYITISSTGSVQDFGDLNSQKNQLTSCSSSTRGVFGGGFTTPVNTNVIEYITISSTGNAQDFGDLSVAKNSLSSCSSSTRGIFGGGEPTTNVIEFITISSTGNAQDFGDLGVGKLGLSSCSSPTRGIFGGADPGTNVIEYVTIASTGDAKDFGDLNAGKGYTGACSNGHGGL